MKVLHISSKKLSVSKTTPMIYFFLDGYQPFQRFVFFLMCYVCMSVSEYVHVSTGTPGVTGSHELGTQPGS